MAPKRFHHPFQPYTIQEEFMQAVYDCIEDGKVGIFESPTGTGKSLSLICGSLTWLREHKRRTFEAAMEDTEADDDEPAWLAQHARAAKHKDALAMRAEFEARLEKLREQEASIRKRANSSKPAHKRTRMNDTDVALDADDEDFALEDFYSDEDEASNTTYSRNTTELLDKLGLMPQKMDSRSMQEQEEDVKVFFCSRTHSQLSQLVGELHRVKLPSTLPPLSAQEDAVEQLRQISLGSRKNLCINPKVNGLQSQTAINERCLELQQSSSTRCEFLPRQDRPELLLDFRDSALANIRDIEDLAQVGKSLGVCPYYASRSAIGPAEVVTLPYSLLIQRSTRGALGINLKGSVVIIDEAHNLVAAVESAFTTQVSSIQLQAARADLIAYLHRFKNRLAGSNRVYAAQVVRLLDSLLGAVLPLYGHGGTLKPEMLLAGKGVDQIDLPKLVRYISDSKLARKVEGYAARERSKQARNNNPADATPSDIPALTLMAKFVLSLVNPAQEGSFFWSRESNGVVLRYLLLDPAEHFRDVVQEARAVILAGGTMSPMDDHIRQLFPYVPDVRTLSCGHIVPTSSLLVRVLSNDAAGSMEYNYKTRSNPELMQRTGRILLRLANLVDGGMVVFFSSYAYLEGISQAWEQSGITAQMTAKKQLFFDSRTRMADATFDAYKNAVRSEPNGAMLCSVIGGKLSEGINFSDELGRCVIVVGLPFPNLETPEWKAKMQYLERKQGSDHSNISGEFAENTCMRAVNQAIGRAIRHKNDWASIVLIDARYSQPRIQAKLPAWIRDSLVKTAQANDEVAQLCASIDTFFGQRRTTAEVSR